MVNDDSQSSNQVVEHPTYLQHIRHFFGAQDIACMRGLSIDLQTYSGVRFNAERIYFRTKEGTMPPDEDRRWSEGRVQTFRNWMRDGFPRGEAPMVDAPPRKLIAERVRKDLASIDPDGEEMVLLKRAFQGLIDRDPDDPQSYFQLAGLHWLPGPEVYCRHHENAYHPWHRAYLQKFEDALRSVEGCEEVTLPYWNIQSKAPDNIFSMSDDNNIIGIPGVLYTAPFDKYILPRRLENLDGSEVYEEGSTTERNAEAAILCLLGSRQVSQNIQQALSQSRWEYFNGWDAGRTQDGIIRAHDNGHVACGPTLANQDVAAFDPMFWFFHCNWDRLWWKWQRLYGATTLEAFKTHLAGSADWLEDNILNRIDPFAARTRDMIDLSQLGIDYADPVEENPPVVAANAHHDNTPAGVGVALAHSGKASVRVEEVQRLDIPGSFDVLLMVGRRVVGRQSFFQATTPKLCATCRKKAKVSFDFIVDQAVLNSGPIWAIIEHIGRSGKARRILMTDCGSPTISVRLLLVET